MTLPVQSWLSKWFVCNQAVLELLLPSSVLKSNSRRLKILLGADFTATVKTHKRCTSSQFHSLVRKTARRVEPQHKLFNAIIKTTNHWVLTCFVSWSFYGKWYLEATNLAVTFTLQHLQWMQLPLLLEGSQNALAQPHWGREISLLAHCLCGHELMHLQGWPSASSSTP